MISIDTASLLKQIQDLEALITRKLEATVKGFTNELSSSVIALTPVGDLAQYASFYASRTPPWPQYPGMAISNWEYTTSGASYRPIADPSGKPSFENIRSGLSTYKLGDNFKISNSVPYIGMLEQGHSPQAADGFMLQAATRAFSVDLKRYFDAQK